MKVDDNDLLRAGQLPADPFDGCDPVPVATGADPDVRAALETVSADSEKPKGTLQNVLHVLHTDPRWAGKVRYNEFASVVELHGTPVDPDHVARADDVLDTYTAAWLADNYLRMTVPTPRVTEALAAIARRNTYHPVRAYLAGLEWDGLPRLEEWLIAYLGVEDAPVVRALGPAFLRSCVARVLRRDVFPVGGPGCKVDTTLILVGNQGAFKSTALRTLAVDPAWFADTRLDLGSKDMFEQIQGRWIYEIAELDAFKGRDWSRIKSILSSPSDNYRRPYGHHAIQAERQVVFAGTTNEDEFLGDPTGARRFWPVRCTRINLAALERDRDQLWAEAVKTYRAGASWWLGADAAAAMAIAADEFRITDPWEDSIRVWAEQRAIDFSTSDVLEFALQKPKDGWTQHDQSRVCACLRNLGWVKRKARGIVAGTDKRGLRWRRSE